MIVRTCSWCRRKIEFEESELHKVVSCPYCHDNFLLEDEPPPAAMRSGDDFKYSLSRKLLLIIASAFLCLLLFFTMSA